MCLALSFTILVTNRRYYEQFGEYFFCETAFYIMILGLVFNPFRKPNDTMIFII